MSFAALRGAEASPFSHDAHYSARYDMATYRGRLVYFLDITSPDHLLIGAPEMAAALHAACTGEKDVAVGNVVGSNIMNLLSILGIHTTMNKKSLTLFKYITIYEVK